jgi:FAD-dependent urate hydroxylase
VDSPSVEVAVVGAGPYGLSAAAYLRDAGVETQVYGETMSFWKQHMPVGMLLRSQFDACHIGHPLEALTLKDYERLLGERFSDPVPLGRFIEYGEWFGDKIAPDVDRRRIERVSRNGSGFVLELEDGVAVSANRVVVAAGIEPFAWRPQPFSDLGPEHASHTSEQRDLGVFAGKRVVVVGGGQSAVETAALLHEEGAEAELIARRPSIRWLSEEPGVRWSELPPLKQRLHPPTGLGPIGLNWLVASPQAYRYLPRGAFDWVADFVAGPAAASWVRHRLGGVTLTTGRTVEAASANGGVTLRLDDGSKRYVDHVMLGTGYRVDIARYRFLDRELVNAVRGPDGCPRMTDGFETPVRGLHFIGATAWRTFGPIFRFVVGTRYGMPMLRRAVLHGRTRRPASDPLLVAR